MGQKVGSKNMTVYGYARVSTQGQDLKDQVEQLIKNGVEPDNIFQESSLEPPQNVLNLKPYNLNF